MQIIGHGFPRLYLRPGLRQGVPSSRLPRVLPPLVLGALLSFAIDLELLNASLVVCLVSLSSGRGRII